MEKVRCMIVNDCPVFRPPRNREFIFSSVEEVRNVGQQL